MHKGLWNRPQLWIHFNLQQTWTKDRSGRFFIRLVEAGYYVTTRCIFFALTQSALQLLRLWWLYFKCQFVSLRGGFLVQRFKKLVFFSLVNYSWYVPIQTLFLKKWANPGVFFVYFRSFQTKTIQFSQQIIVKNVNPEYSTGIQTHGLSNTSRHP